MSVGRKSVCTVCRQITAAPRVKHQERRKTDLTDQHVVDMLVLALSRNTQHFTILALLASGFRRSEISGGDDNGVELPGLQARDVHAEEEYVWVYGKNSKQIQQPVPHMILEAALRLGSREEKLVPWVTSHAVGDIVKGYAALAGLPDAELVTSHRLRHWFSGRVKTHGGTKPGVEGLVEWADVMRHSRKGLGQVTTLSFYSGPFTPFERRREIVKSALQGVLDQLGSPSAPQNDTVPLRISQNSVSFPSSKISERDNPLDSIVLNSQVDSSNAGSNPTGPGGDSDVSSPVHRCQWPRGCDEPARVHLSVGWFCEPHSHDPFGSYTVASLPELAPVDPHDADKAPELAVASEPSQPSREQILDAWRKNCERDHQDILKLEAEHKMTWHCTRDGCTGRAFCCDAKNGRLICEIHAVEPPDWWQPG